MFTLNQCVFRRCIYLIIEVTRISHIKANFDRFLSEKTRSYKIKRKKVEYYGKKKIYKRSKLTLYVGLLLGVGGHGTQAEHASFTRQILCSALLKTGSFYGYNLLTLTLLNTNSIVLKLAHWVADIPQLVVELFYIT